MRTDFKQLLAVLAFSSLFFSGLQGLWACSCIELSHEEHFQRSDAVFRGLVKKSKVESGKRGRGDDEVLKIKVMEQWKGNLPRVVKIRTYAQDAACGYPFSVGKEYLIFAAYFGENGDLRTNLCDGTLPWAKVGPEIETVLRRKLAS